MEKTFKYLLEADPKKYGMDISRKGFELLTANRAREWIDFKLKELGLKVACWNCTMETGSDKNYLGAITFIFGKNRTIEIPELGVWFSSETIPVDFNQVVFDAIEKYQDLKIGKNNE